MLLLELKILKYQALLPEAVFLFKVFSDNFTEHSGWVVDSEKSTEFFKTFRPGQSFKLDSFFTLSLLVPSKPIPFKQLHVSPIQSPSLSSEASTDEEVADIHARRFAGTHVEQIEQLRR